ncbi:hypothetical protein ASD24_29665 [Paenibacillus sp. Root52]|uniref:hypothetical protein n=1 Tax=Paenibacillus sp. Root52 TaxID=1736552 RepID=UPI0006F4AB32|nr:hypothetical protein [Paenibacillus sp. Root52]KQY83607.1 hypothetical protein ASD24_29665 [Paenibacillus sp. Root52]
MTLYSKRPGLLAALVRGVWYLIEGEQAWEAICSFAPSTLGKQHRTNSKTYKEAINVLRQNKIAL